MYIFTFNYDLNDTLSKGVTAAGNGEKNLVIY